MAKLLSPRLAVRLSRHVRWGQKRRHRACPIVNVQRFEHEVYMHLHGSLREPKSPRDLLVRKTLGEQLQHRVSTGGQQWRWQLGGSNCRRKRAQTAKWSIPGI